MDFSHLYPRLYLPRQRTTTLASYSKSAFYCEASDKRGHSQQIRINPETHGHLAAILANPSLPYKTYQDFARDAIVHRLHWLEENMDDEAIKAEARRLLAQAELDRRARIISSERRLVDSLREAVNTPEQRVFLTREQIDETLAAITTPVLHDEAERVVSGLSLS